ncbi:hypothetical protein LF817_14115 [Halobacillus sp. A1]|uniref:hypothetical protein n=1 Tax=Halobacillus sp. A1 TaxID=2880262 RepID=UPI0020A66E75|nr:hypothetical protein [Halobacillus sp. A1]MCP3032458.1 hypothetical protein [Halobacillus sp. A1]
MHRQNGFPGFGPGGPGGLPGFGPGQGGPGGFPGYGPGQGGPPGGFPGYGPGQGGPGGFPGQPGGGSPQAPPFSADQLPPPPSSPPASAQGAELFAVDPGSLYGCLYRYTWIRLNNGQRFWFFPVFIGRTSVAGYRWRPNRRRWDYFGIDTNRIASFSC